MLQAVTLIKFGDSLVSFHYCGNSVLCGSLSWCDCVLSHRSVIHNVF